MSQRPSRFTVAAWLFFAYLIAVILFGAWVRISHSGAGCGSNWPTCGGEVIPTAPSTATLIEFVHRVSSGFCGIFGLAILVWSWVRFGFGVVTRAAALTLVFIVFEGAIGAGLVLGELVADDDSVARAVVIALHLGNTLALTAFSALTAWRSGSRDAPRFLGRRRIAFSAGLVLIVLTAMTGAVTALGDTLFPKELAISAEWFAQIGSDLSASNHFLVRLRVVHPTLAIVAAGYLIWLLNGVATSNQWARAAMYLTAIQVALGFFDIGLSAPAWLQILHLLAAQGLWMTLILTCASIDRGAEKASPARA